MSRAENRAVFLSYASQDAEAARRIAEALRAAGIEVWFDQNELVGGDAWDQKIRRQIKDCALFVPVISANTNARPEGYFRLEWKLAVDRSHLMADDAPFLFPIVIGDVSDATARVPDKFREVQWTRLRLDETPAELAARVARLLTEDVGRDRRIPPSAREAGSGDPALQRKSAFARWWWLIFPIMGMAVPVARELRSLFPVERTAPGGAGRPGGSQDEAVRLVRQARDLIYDPDSARAEFALADNLVRRAAELAPASAEVWGVSALLNHWINWRSYDPDRDRLVRSQEQAQQALLLDPHNVDALLALGLHRQRLEESERAQEYLDRAARLAPDNPRVQIALAYQETDPSVRGEQLMAAAARSSTPAELFYYAALSRITDRREAEALVLTDRCLAVKPFWRAWVQRAHVEYLVNADPVAMEAWLARVEERKRDEPRFAILRFLAALVRRDGAAAVRALEAVAADQFVDNFHTGPKAFLLAQAHELAGEPARARDHWTRAVRTMRQRLAEAPGDIETRGQLAVSLAALGEGVEARQLAEALESDRRALTDRISNEYLAQTWLRLGDNGRALTALHRVPASTGFGDVTPATIVADPRWDALETHPEFPALVEHLRRGGRGDAPSS